MLLFSLLGNSTFSSLSRLFSFFYICAVYIVEIISIGYTDLSMDPSIFHSEYQKQSVFCFVLLVII